MGLPVTGAPGPLKPDGAATDGLPGTADGPFKSASVTGPTTGPVDQPGAGPLNPIVDDAAARPAGPFDPWKAPPPKMPDAAGPPKPSPDVSFPPQPSAPPKPLGA